MWQYNDPNALMHYGVKGMKWGVRRYQNEDGTLTEAGKKRIHKQYANEQKKGDRSLYRAYTNLYDDANNKAADRLNRGEMDRFNEDQRKKYGENYSYRSDYLSDYEKFSDEIVQEIFSKSIYDFYQGNKHYQKAQSLVKQYDMLSWDEMAKNNQEAIDILRSNFEGSKKKVG